MTVTYNLYEEWQKDANEIGWVHCHDNFVVCDDDYGCVGEFNSDTNTGWLIINPNRSALG